MALSTSRIGLLGPVEVVAGDRPHAVTGRRRKAVLAALGMHAGQIVSTQRLIDIVWGSSPPVTALNTLQRHVSSLRGDRGIQVPIAGRSPGYLLEISPDETDVVVAEGLIRSAPPDNPATMAGRLREALRLWRGKAFIDVPRSPWFDEQAARLEELRLEAKQQLIDIRLQAGEHASLLPELEELIEEYPFRENLHRQLMLALYNAGRQADALAAYRRLQRTLGDELGIDPSKPLRDLELAILRQDSDLRAHEATSPLPTAWQWRAYQRRMPIPVPAQLPLALPSFTGREAVIDKLDTILASGAARTPVVISGMAGVGKTALAVHWAHRIAGEYPDGQLYANLCGFHPGDTAKDPADVLRGFLEAFGFHADQQPSGVDAQTGLLRSILAGKRALLLLDNARDAAQVRPFLPGSPLCLMIVTSRNRLDGLVAIDGAHSLQLELPSLTEAREMLTGRLGAGLASADPADIDEIVFRCARLPLALAIVAGRIAVGGDRLDLMAAQLRKAARTLEPFDAPDPASDIRAVMSWSYCALGRSDGEIFRLLGLCPSAEFATEVAASLAGIPVAQARHVLTELTRMNLLSIGEDGRYSLHDLLRAYARELTHGHDDDEGRRWALHRMMDHYLHTAYRAVRLLAPNRLPIDIGSPGMGVTVCPLTDREKAMSWFTVEHPALVDLLGSVTAQPDRRVWELAWTIQPFLEMRGDARENLAVQAQGLKHAQALNDLEAMAFSHRSFGGVLGTLGRFDDALTHTTAACELFRQAGNSIGEAYTRLNLCWIADCRGDHAEALRQALLGLGTLDPVDDIAGKATALGWVARSHARLGDAQRAIGECRQAFKLFLKADDRRGQAWVWETLGYLHASPGHYGKAVDGYRAVGDWRLEAEALVCQGDAYRSRTDVDSARTVWREALGLLELFDPRSDTGRRESLLRRLGT